MLLDRGLVNNLPPHTKKGLAMFGEKDGLFKNRGHDIKFDVDTDSRLFYATGLEQALITLCDSINKNKEVAGLLSLVDGDIGFRQTGYSIKYVYGVLCFTKILLINLSGLVDLKIKDAGVLNRVIFNNAVKGVVKERINKLPSDTTAKDVFECFNGRGIFFDSNILKKSNISRIYISHEKIYKIIYVIEKVGPDNCTSEIVHNAIKEIDEVLNTMIGGGFLRYSGNITYHHYFDDSFDEFKAKEEVIEGAEAMEDNTQTLTLNRPAKQQENKLLTVGNKKAYQVGKGDYKHRNGVIIEEEKKEMRIEGKFFDINDSVLADLEDLLNNVIDNPDTVDEIVNYLAKNAPAAHFISEMIGCGEIKDEESLAVTINKAVLLSQRIINAGKENITVLNYEHKIFNYLNVDYPKPIFGKWFSLGQLVFCFEEGAQKISDIFAKAKEEEEEEKEEVTSNDDVPEHAEKDDAAYDEYPTDLAELEKLLEEYQKEGAELQAELKQAEEEQKRKELIEKIIAAKNSNKEMKERLAKLREK